MRLVEYLFGDSGGPPQPDHGNNSHMPYDAMPLAADQEPFPHGTAIAHLDGQPIEHLAQGYSQETAMQYRHMLGFHESLDEAACGQCFEWAYQQAMKGRGILHHGTVIWLGESQRKDHAWIVRGGRVFDWQMVEMGFGGKFRGKGYPPDVFKELFQPKGVKAYKTDLDAIHAQGRANKRGQGFHYGPWESLDEAGVVTDKFRVNQDLLGESQLSWAQLAKLARPSPESGTDGIDDPGMRKLTLPAKAERSVYQIARLHGAQFPSKLLADDKAMRRWWKVAIDGAIKNWRIVPSDRMQFKSEIAVDLVSRGPVRSDQVPSHELGIRLPSFLRHESIPGPSVQSFSELLDEARDVLLVAQTWLTLSIEKGYGSMFDSSLHGALQSKDRKAVAQSLRNMVDWWDRNGEPKRANAAMIRKVRKAVSENIDEVLKKGVNVQSAGDNAAISKLESGKYPARAEDGLGFCFQWADGRGICAFKLRADALRWAKEQPRDIVKFWYGEPVHSNGKFRIRVRDRYRKEESVGTLR